MHEHIAHCGHLFADLVLDRMSNAMPLLHAHGRIHLHVHVHEVLVTHLAHEAFFHAVHSGRGLADIMAGTERPAPTAPGGRGLWISRQLVDEFAIESGPAGTTARFAISLDGDAVDLTDDETA